MFIPHKCYQYIMALCYHCTWSVSFNDACMSKSIHSEVYIDAKMCHYYPCCSIASEKSLRNTIWYWIAGVYNAQGCTSDSIIVCSTMSVPWTLLYLVWVKCTVDTTVSFGVPNGVLWTPLILRCPGVQWTLSLKIVSHRHQHFWCPSTQVSHGHQSLNT